MSWLFVLTLFLAVAAATLLGSGYLVQFLRRRAVLDQPNARSSHQIPTPRGAGIAVIGVILVTWIILAWGFPALIPGRFTEPGAIGLLCLCALVLALVSLIDDLRGLPPLARLGVQFAVTLIGFSTLPGSDEGLVFQGLLPPLMDKGLSVIAWVWFLNLFNFMDGIDGITGIEAGTIGAGLFLLALIGGTDPGIGIFGLTITAAALGFLWWNWPPARIFIGDVGSAPLGFLLGWLLLGLAISGAWAAALILPLAYLTDATWTLLRRLTRGEKIWQAHAQHFYQRALGLGMGHGDVARFFLITDLGLVALALASTTKSFPGAPWLALSGACILVFGLFYRLTRKSPDP